MKKLGWLGLTLGFGLGMAGFGLGGCLEGTGSKPGSDGGDATQDNPTPDPDKKDTGSGGDSDAGDGGGGGVPGTGLSAMCGFNGTDQCATRYPDRPICDPQRGCVECLATADCGPYEQCLAGKCVDCSQATQVTDCLSPGQVCWPTIGACRDKCANNQTCGVGNVCDKEAGACVGCMADTDCPTTGHCSTDTRTCTQCEDDTRCRILAGDPDSGATGKRCHPAERTCRQCLRNGDCGSGPTRVCDPRTFTCVTGCNSDAACNGQKCDLATATCVAIPVVDAGSDAAPDSGDAGPEPKDGGGG